MRRVDIASTAEALTILKGAVNLLIEQGHSPFCIHRAESGASVEAQLIYDGRNKLYRISLPEGAVVVKHFARPSWLQSIYYSLLGRSKAARSHHYAEEIAHRGVGVALSVGYTELRNRWGFLRESFYVSRDMGEGAVHLQAHARGWAAPEGFMPALANYLRACHRAGIEHLDLSPGNILYTYDAKQRSYRWAMVDLNRMRLHDRPLTPLEVKRNLVRLMNTPSTSRRLAYYYAVGAGWQPKLFVQALTEACDRFWRGRWLKLSARYCRRRYGLGYGAFALEYLRYRWALLRGEREVAARLYRQYLQREDIRHIERRRRGFSYQYEN